MKALFLKPYRMRVETETVSIICANLYHFWVKNSINEKKVVIQLFIKNIL